MPKHEPEPDTLTPEERARSDRNATLAFYALVILPWILAPFFISTAGFEQSFHFAQQPGWLTPHICFLVMALSTPHVFYYFTWTQSRRWHALCKRNNLVAYKTFAKIAHVIKAFQFASIFAWVYWRLDIAAQPAVLLDTHPLKLLLCVHLFVVGQLLNAMVYEKIGEAGVYYGTRLGVHVPWVYGFPFSVVPHPQYFGATLSFTAMFLLLATEQAVREGIYIPMVSVAIMYAFSSWVEANL